MYTQCPKCLTYFQVTAEHLKVAQGNVRCGQCSNVFSALGNLSQVPPQQNTPQTKSQPNNSSNRVAGQKSSPPAASSKNATDANAQSKLTNAIAAIQALNQSSQKILSQGRKNYVSQLQKQAQAKRKNSTSNNKDVTARNLSQDELETIAKARSDSDIDIEEALAAVEGIEVDEDEMNFQYGVTDDDDITPDYDGSHLVEDYRNKDSSDNDSKPGHKKRPKIIKTNSIEDDIFDFSELDIPEAEKTDAKESGAGKKSKQPEARKQNRSRKKPTPQKKTEDKKTPVSESVVSRTKHEAPPAIASAKSKSEPHQAANEHNIIVPQHIVEEPEVIIENNIPTLAIPKALLEDFEREKISHVNYKSMLTWGGLSVLMMLVFLGQAIYFKHNELGQISQLRPWVQMFCKHASCELTLQVDIGKIELLGQDIRTHPKTDKALLVSATIINNASYTQPYPGLQLSFSDINGVKVATRHFLPKDYLPSKFTSKKGMESNIPIQLEIELVDPGKSAVNFEFDFFSI